MLELLEKYEACEMPFARFLELLPPLKPRYYSISSSPRSNPGQASITVGVVQGSAWSGRGEYRGVASNYLADRRPEEEIVMFVDFNSPKIRQLRLSWWVPGQYSSHGFFPHGKHIQNLCTASAGTEFIRCDQHPCRRRAVICVRGWQSCL